MKDLNDYIYAYLNAMDDTKEDNDIDSREDEMLKYINSMPRNEETKTELLDNIGSFDMDELYEAVFDKCGELLSVEEYYRLKHRFDRVFSLELPESCQDIEYRIFTENDILNEDKLRRAIKNNPNILIEYFEQFSVTDVDFIDEKNDRITFAGNREEFRTDFSYFNTRFRLQNGDKVYMSASVLKELDNPYFGAIDDPSGRKIISPYQSDLVIVMRKGNILFCKKLYG